jgi:hypothetical protein
MAVEKTLRLERVRVTCSKESANLCYGDFGRDFGLYA